MTRLSGGYDPDHFEVDGSLRDVCVVDAGLSVWERLLRGVAAAPWEHRLEVNEEPRDPADFSVGEFFSAREKADMSARLAVRVGEVWFVSYFFDVEEVEFTFGPEDLAGGEHFGSLERFMVWLAEVCDRKVIMTAEHSSGHEGVPAMLETIP